MLRPLCALVCLWIGLDASPAIADADAAGAPRARDLPHVEVRAGLGGTLRLVRHGFLEQDRFAPPYLEWSAGFTLGRGLPFQSGAGLLVAAPLVGDGGLLDGVEQLQQWTITPVYLARREVGTDWTLGGHVGPSWVRWPGGRSWGGELALQVAHRWLAGAGTYAEAVFAYYRGARSTHHPTASLEIGVFVRGEVLP